MNLHKHARLTPRGRALLVQHMLTGLRAEGCSTSGGVSVRTAYKWLRRFREEGESGLMDRSSRPHSCPHGTLSDLVAHLIQLRRARHTYHRSPNYSAWPSVPLRVVSNRQAFIVWPSWSPPLWWCAMNIPRPATCYLWISRSLADSGGLATE